MELILTLSFLLSVSVSVSVSVSLSLSLSLPSKSGPSRSKRTFIDLYDMTSKTLRSLYIHNRRVHVTSASIDPSQCLLAFTTVSPLSAPSPLPSSHSPYPADVREEHHSGPMDGPREKEKEEKEKEKEKERGESERELAARLEAELVLDWEDLVVDGEGNTSRKRDKEKSEGDLTVAIRRPQSFDGASDQKERVVDEQARMVRQHSAGRKLSQSEKAASESSSDPDGSDTLIDPTGQSSDPKSHADSSPSDPLDGRNSSPFQFGPKWSVKYATFLVSIMVCGSEEKGEGERERDCVCLCKGSRGFIFCSSSTRSSSFCVRRSGERGELRGWDWTHLIHNTSSFCPKETTRNFLFCSSAAAESASSPSH
jgi:hypothetical protein